MDWAAGERVIYALDRDGDGYVGWTEFTAGALCIGLLQNRRLVDAAFASLDQDRDGKLSIEDLNKVLAQGPSTAEWKTSMPDLFNEMAGDAKSSSDLWTLPGGKVLKVLRKTLKGSTHKHIDRDRFAAYVGVGSHLH